MKNINGIIGIDNTNGDILFNSNITGSAIIMHMYVHINNDSNPNAYIHPIIQLLGAYVIGFNTSSDNLNIGIRILKTITPTMHPKKCAGIIIANLAGVILPSILSVNLIGNNGKLSLLINGRYQREDELERYTLKILQNHNLV